jgi:2'-5' RNA ligase
MEQIRSFIAIELPEEVRVGLARLQDSLKARGYTPVKWVNPQGIHLTLKFLGNISSDKVVQIVGAMEEAARKIAPFRLEVSGLGVFPDPRRPRVAWVGLSGEIDSLMRLQQLIDSGLVPLGFARESRPFTAHLTLARLREGISPQERRSFGELIVSSQFETTYSFDVDSISLMRSTLTPTGALYSRLASIKLG